MAMRYQRTQVYLTVAQHRRLLAEARSRGISLAALIRESVTSRAAEREASYGDKGFDAIIGIAEGPSGDVAKDKDLYLRQAYLQRHEKKMGRRPAKPRRAAKRRKPESRTP
jgi:hypothetical protein